MSRFLITSWDGGGNTGPALSLASASSCGVTRSA
jgi:hypothetical protein